MTTVTLNLDLPAGQAPAGAKVQVWLAGTSGQPVLGYVDGKQIVGEYNVNLDDNGAGQFTLVGNDAIEPTGTRWGLRIRLPHGPNPDPFYIDVPSTGGPYTVESVLDEAPGALPSTALSVETAEREAADEDLQTQIDGLGSGTALADEITARQAADTALDARLDVVEADLPTKAETDASNVAASAAAWLAAIGAQPAGTYVSVVRDEGTSLGSFTELDFAGASVTVTDAGSGRALVTISATTLTQEQIEDFVGALVQDSSVLDVTYDDPGGAITITIKAGAVTNAMLAGSIDQAKITNLVSDLAAKQPLDSDLTAIAALTTTSFGRALLELVDAAAGRTAFGLGTASTHAHGDYDLAGAAAAAQAASQPLDSDLTAIAALTTTAYGRAFLELANAAAARTALALGTAAVANTGDFDAAGAAAAAQAASQPLDTDLTAIAALVSAANKIAYATGAGTWALTDFTAAGRALVDDADASAQLTTLGVSTFIKTLLDDADAATALATLGAAALASPTFTGDPKAPTASPGDNDTSIATTAFVTAAIAAAAPGFDLAQTMAFGG